MKEIVNNYPYVEQHKNLVRKEMNRRIQQQEEVADSQKDPTINFQKQLAQSLC